MSSTPDVQLEPDTTEPPPRQTVLVVDDDVTQVAALEYRLERLGFHVCTAHSGQRALEVAFSESPQLVLLDLCLPDMEGFEVCSRLADDPRTCGTPVIIVSGLGPPEIVRRSRAVGGEYFLRKPYDPNVLLTLIERAIQEAQDL